MSQIQNTLHSARLIGLANVLRTIRYALRRDRLDARYKPPIQETAPRLPGILRSAEISASGASFQFEASHLSIRFLAPDFVFFAWDHAAMTPSYAVACTRWPDVDVSLVPLAEQGWQIRSSALDIRVAMDGTVRFLDAAGQQFRQEHAPRKTGGGWQQQAQLTAGAALVGLGERAAHLNLRPGCYRFWNWEAGGQYAPGDDPLYITMPVYLCLQPAGNYLVFYDNTFDGRLTLHEQAELDFQGGPLRYYLALGTPADLLDRFTTLTGRAPLPPRWALGYQQSQWGYRSEAEMRRIFGEFKRHGLPLSALVLDIDLQQGYRTLSVNTESYPQLKDFSLECAASGVHLIAIIDPGIKQDPTYNLYQQGLSRNAYCKTPGGIPLAGVVWPGWSVFPDFTDPQVRTWWGEQYARLLQYGIDGFWHDMNEPSSFAAWGEKTFPLCTLHNLDGSPGDHRQAHNVYGMLMNQAGYEGLRRLNPDRRPFILSRSGWVGMQRYAWAWTGDIQTSWEMLHQTISSVLGLSLSGLPYAGPDIGGFSGSPSPELYVRWLQLGAFMPFFRTHSAFYLPRREPWELGEEVLSIAKKILKLRAQLLPYWYTLAWQASQNGTPLLKPLFWHAPQDASLRVVDDAYFVGDSLLVAPVVQEGARQRSIVLPQGEWYAFESGEKYAGEQTIQVQAPLDRIPIFVRAGSLLPLQQGSHLELHLYRPAPGGSGSGLLYSDAGDGFGAYRLDTFHLERAGESGFTLQRESVGDFAWPYPSLSLHLHGFTAQNVWVDEQEVRLQQGKYLIQPFKRILIPG